MCAAYRRGLHLLDLPAAERDPTDGVRWLSFAAERGETTAAETVSQIFNDGAPVLPRDATAAAGWSAKAEETTRNNLRPRAPLRKKSELCNYGAEDCR